MTAPLSPARDQLAEAQSLLRLIASDLRLHGEEWPMARQFARRIDAMEARVQAAANQRAAEVGMVPCAATIWPSWSDRWMPCPGVIRRGHCSAYGTQHDAANAAALASPAPAPRAEEAP